MPGYCQTHALGRLQQLSYLILYLISYFKLNSANSVIYSICLLFYTIHRGEPQGSTSTLAKIGGNNEELISPLYQQDCPSHHHLRRQLKFRIPIASERSRLWGAHRLLSPLIYLRPPTSSLGAVSRPKTFKCRLVHIFII